jgi:hypothetical protein
LNTANYEILKCDVTITITNGNAKHLKIIRLKAIAFTVPPFDRNVRLNVREGCRDTFAAAIPFRRGITIWTFTVRAGQVVEFMFALFAQAIVLVS